MRYLRRRELPSPILLALAEQVDAELGALSRGHIHDLELEAEILPLQLELWQRVRDRLSPGQMLGLRTTGTLASLAHALESRKASHENLARLLGSLERLRLTEGELDAFARRRTLRTLSQLRPARDPEYAFGLVDSPLRLYQRAQTGKTWKTLGPPPQGEDARRELTMASVSRVMKPLTGDPSWNEYEAQVTAGLPLRLNLYRQALRTRLDLGADSNLDPSLASQAGTLEYRPHPGWLPEVPLSLTLPALSSGTDRGKPRGPGANETNAARGHSKADGR